jgi:transcriptional repressor NrdR
MRCPFCGNLDTQVKDSRMSEDKDVIKRRRNCLECDSRFTTFEKVDLKEIIVIKKNGDKKIFDSNKVKKSVEMAVRKRPVSQLEVDQLVNNIIKDLESLNEDEIESSKLGELVMKALQGLDHVAFVRFASVYKNFETTNDFKKFISKIVIEQ